jgi:predicted metalloprotease with PDZ domain
MSDRRRVDYYDEGSLIWLEADVLIRQKSNGRLSLDDFFHRFHGRGNTAAQVVTYDLNEIVNTLNQVVPYDWRKFFLDRVYTVRERAPLGGITNGGWSLVYNSTPNLITEPPGSATRGKNFMFSIGLIVNSSGELRDVSLGSPAGKAGLAPGMKITRVDDTDFSLETITRAVAATADGTGTIRLAAQNGGETRNYDISYTGGERYPHLMRQPAGPDLISAIASPR